MFSLLGLHLHLLEQTRGVFGLTEDSARMAIEKVLLRNHVLPFSLLAPLILLLSLGSLVVENWRRQ